MFNQKEYNETHKEHRKEYNKNYYQEHKEQIKESSKEYRQENKVHIKEYHKNYQQEHKAERNKYRTARKLRDPKFKLRRAFSNLVSNRLKRACTGKSGKSTFNYVPYTVGELIIHLSKSFYNREDGLVMSLENYGLWHVDHIIPDISFNYTSPTDENFKKAWALTNLQPLWAKENLEKHSKLDWVRK